MVSDYLLMHKKESYGLISIDHEIGAMVNAEIMRPEYAPYLGKATDGDMRMWWIGRSIPNSRKSMIKKIEALGYTCAGDFLAKNLALSISDTYWICPVDMELEWDDVNLFNHNSNEKDVIPFHSAHSFDSSASLGGEMDKYWDVSGEAPVLHKIGMIADGQQSVNECFATWIHSTQRAGVPYVEYRLDEDDGTAGQTACCRAFSSRDVEFVSAKEIIPAGRKSEEPYSAFIDTCARNGLDRHEVQWMMDYQTITDFILSNVDRHRGNFGILRDANNLNFISLVPIFDSGNSMFFMDKVKEAPYTRDELEQIMINSLYYSESQMLDCVINKDAVKLSELPDRVAVRDFYTERGISKAKAEFIALNYEEKIKMLKLWIYG